jgi:uncharacterized membrane protein (UPF0127 family)
MSPARSLIACAAILFVSCAPPSPSTRAPSKGNGGGPAVTIGGRTIPVEVWTTERERRSTLYRLPRLEEGHGLLLAWPRERFVKVESGGSPESYDALFLDRSGKLVDRQDLQAGDSEGLMSRAEAAYALLLPRKTLDPPAGAVLGLPAGIAAQDLPAMDIGGATAHVELALSEADREHGLMFRPRMSGDDGMLFAYSSESPHTFWMMNTLIPLDIAFFRADGTLINVNETPIAANPRHEPVPRSPSAGNARYVLEMNLGWFRKKGLTGEDGKPKPGVKATIPAEAVRGRFD